MQDRYDNIKQQWIEAAPSDKYYGLMPDIRQQSKDDLQYLLNESKGIKTPPPSVIKPTAEANVPHEVIFNNKIVGYTTDGGKTMTTTAPAGARPVGTAVQ
jgi:hypothetical protein